MCPERAFVTVLFLDMVGSTERASELGDRRWRKLIQTFHRRVRREISSFGGREIMSAGDGFLATFQDPGTAILCAWAMREALREIDDRAAGHGPQDQAQDGRNEDGQEPPGG